jgi:hypothetical protein
MTDSLTEALKTAALCGLIVLALALGSVIDRTRDVEDALQAERAQAAKMAAQAARTAYQQGLDEGAERELFRQQQRLAAMEQQP